MIYERMINRLNLCEDDENYADNAQLNHHTTQKYV
jgi:hypothetical protein